MHKLEKQIIKACRPHESKPVALSGGLDSSLLAAIVNPKFVISVKLPYGKPYDESKYSEKVADRLDLDRIVVEPPESKFDEYTKKAVKALSLIHI